MREHLAACRELAMDYKTLPELLFVFEHKTHNILIHASYNHIMAFWQVGDIPPLTS